MEGEEEGKAVENQKKRKIADKRRKIFEKFDSQKIVYVKKNTSS